MNRVYWVVVFFGFWLGCGFLMQGVQGADLKDAKCVTMVNPSQCDTVGICLAGQSKCTPLFPAGNSLAV
jgi:hypothetical protein